MFKNVYNSVESEVVCSKYKALSSELGHAMSDGVRLVPIGERITGSPIL